MRVSWRRLIGAGCAITVFAAIAVAGFRHVSKDTEPAPVTYAGQALVRYHQAVGFAQEILTVAPRLPDETQTSVVPNRLQQPYQRFGVYGSDRNYVTRGSFTTSGAPVHDTFLALKRLPAIPRLGLTGYSNAHRNLARFAFLHYAYARHSLRPAFAEAALDIVIGVAPDGTTVIARYAEVLAHPVRMPAEIVPVRGVNARVSTLVTTSRGRLVRHLRRDLTRAQAGLLAGAFNRAPVTAPLMCSGGVALPGRHTEITHTVVFVATGHRWSATIGNRAACGTWQVRRDGRLLPAIEPTAELYHLLERYAPAGG